MTTTMKVLLLVLACALPQQGIAQKVTVHPDENEQLTARVNWAHGEANGRDGYWVGYHITKFMRPNVWMGSIGGKNWGRRKSLYALIGQEGREEELPDELKENLGFSMRGTMHFGKDKRVSDVRIARDIGILMYFKHNGEGPADVYLSNMSLGVDLDNKPLFWLGKADGESSVLMLQDMYHAAARKGIKSDLLGVISMHDNKARRLEFLTGILQDEPGADLREDAAFWVGQLDMPEGLALLQEVIATDASVDVREHAVFSLSEMSSPEALEALIELAEHGKPKAIRKKAIFWLSQHASKNAIQVIEEIVMDDKDLAIQEQAVFALSQFPPNESVPRLIEIAENHHSVDVRKKAIFWLGDSGDPRAVDALVSLARRKN